MLGRLVWPASRLGELRDALRVLSVVADAPLTTVASRRSRCLPGRSMDFERGTRAVFLELPPRPRAGGRRLCGAGGARAGRRQSPLRRRGDAVRCAVGRLHPCLPRVRRSVQGDRRPPPRRAAGQRARLPQPDRSGGLRRRRRALAGQKTTMPSAWTRLRSAGATGGRDQRSLHARAFLCSIGSCSFFEPVEELEALRMLP